MTHECRPPEGTADDTYHWLRIFESQIVAKWEDGVWWLTGWSDERTASYLTGRGWRYIGPCLPPQVGEGV